MIEPLADDESLNRRWSKKSGGINSPHGLILFDRYASYARAAAVSWANGIGAAYSLRSDDHHPTWLGHLSHDPDHEEALPGIENIAEMKQRVELGPAELSRPVEIDLASKEDIAIQLTEGCILGASPTVWRQ